ncbi:hypothetical protein [Leptothermofonsia sp. ETS-13]
MLLKKEGSHYQVADSLDIAARSCHDQLNLMRQFGFISTLVSYLEKLR